MARVMLCVRYSSQSCPLREVSGEAQEGDGMAGLVLAVGPDAELTAESRPCSSCTGFWKG
jgi:hypothetical protein